MLARPASLTPESTAMNYCNTSQHTATHCHTLQRSATHCNTLQHTVANTATHCSTLRRTATYCNTLKHTTTHCNTLHHTATHCNTLQHTATHCNTLQRTGVSLMYEALSNSHVDGYDSLQHMQHTATHCNTLQHTATHCTTLHHTATHCNTLQHTATHCNTLPHTDASLTYEARSNSRVNGYENAQPSALTLNNNKTSYLKIRGYALLPDQRVDPNSEGLQLVLCKSGLNCFNESRFREALSALVRM